jgi:hypothetical protein
MMLRVWQVEDGYPYGPLAIRLLESFDVNAWVPLLFLAVYGLANPIVMPLRNSIEALIWMPTGLVWQVATRSAMTALHMHMLFRFLGLNSIRSLLPPIPTTNNSYGYKCKEIKLHDYRKRINCYK